MSKQAGRDAQTSGTLLAPPESDGMPGRPLLSLAHLVSKVGEVRQLPNRPAAELVATALESVACLYVTRPDAWAEPLSDGHTWEPRRDARPARVVETFGLASGWSATSWGDSGRHVVSRERRPAVTASPGLFGKPGALALVRLVWGDGATTKVGLNAAKRFGAELERLAVLASDARAILPDVFPPLESRPSQGGPAQADAVPAPAGVPLIEPEGGRWPHQEGAPWTEAERCALFEMRHRLGLSGKALALIAGVTRQRVDELIGAAKPHGGLAKTVAKDGAWSPSAELLARVGAPLQPLQSLQMAVVRRRAA